MPTKPTIKTLTNSSVDILNVIRENGTQNYKDYVPKATKNADDIKKIGAIIMDYPALQNEFLSALVNRIGRVILTSKLYDNPWAFFKKGMLDFGEVVEEIFVNIAKVHTFDPEVAEKEVFKREIPDVKSAFHIMNYQKFYKATISNDQLRQAFLSWSGVYDLIAKIVDAMYTGANYDEFLVMKYMLARAVLDGRLYPVTVPTITTENMTKVVSKIKGVSNDMTFLKSKYNIAGVKTHTPKDRQYLIVNGDFEAEMNVEVLASAFNMNKAEFAGHMVLVDSFGELDTERLKEIFYGDNAYVEINSDELEALNKIPGIMVDEDFFMIFDNYENFTEQYNGEGLYWQYWYHVWKTFSMSPFANNALLIPGTPTVTGVTINPSTATVSKGQSVQLEANVTTTDFAPKTVNWTSSSENTVVDNSGKVTVLSTETLKSVTITATSTFDPSKTGEATITVG